MIKVNDTVLYGSHGVCKVAETVVRRMGGREMEYFLLKPVFERSSSIYVPMQNEALVSKMKRILSAEEIFEMIRSMPDEELLWIENENERRRIFQEILNSGDREQLVRLIKTLYLRQQNRLEQQKNLLMSDEKFLKDAERILYEEFAYVLKIDRDQVLPFIMKQIEVEKRLL